MRLERLPSYASGDRCGSVFGLELVLDRGGLFISQGVILHANSTPGLNSLLTSEHAVGLFPDKSIAWAAGVRKDPILKRYLDTLLLSHNQVNVSYDRMQATTKQRRIVMYDCVNVDLGKSTTLMNFDLAKPKPRSIRSEPIYSDKETPVPLDPIFCLRFKPKTPTPIDIARSTTSSHWLFASLKRMLFNSNGVETHSSRTGGTKSIDLDRNAIPSIVHYIWFGRKNVSLSMYLSFLSSVNIVKPSAIVIHTDCLLEGSYWTQIKQNSLVHVVYREPPRTIFGHRVLYTQHRSDVVRADILEKYGGIYLDWDAVFVKSLDSLLNSRKEVILSRDHIPRPPFPDTINMGVALAKPRSRFIRLWRASLVNYRSKDFLYNAVELPYKAVEAIPYSVDINDRLQVIIAIKLARIFKRAVIMVSE